MSKYKEELQKLNPTLVREIEQSESGNAFHAGQRAAKVKSNDFFKPEDFDFELDSATEVANIANAKLNAALEAAPRVLFECGQLGIKYHSSNKTHEAILFNIEELKQECVKHEPRNIDSFTHNDCLTAFNTTCKHCNVELITEWRAK